MENLKFQLEPEDHQRIQNLCGPTNLFLKQIEKTLEIKISNRGFNFKLSGKEGNLDIGKKVLLDLYEHLSSSNELTQFSVFAFTETEMLNIEINDKSFFMINFFF